VNMLRRNEGKMTFCLAEVNPRSAGKTRKGTAVVPTTRRNEAALI
jgi:hypothetical protein